MSLIKGGAALSIKFVKELMEEIGFPEDARAYLAPEYERLLNNNTYTDIFENCKNRYFDDIEYGSVKNDLKSISDSAGLHIYTVHMLFLLHCAGRLLDEYVAHGMDRRLFVDLMCDLKYKLCECRTVYGINGTFVFDWFHWHYLMKRFALGRFQYEKVRFGYREYASGYARIKSGDEVCNFHIPSSGPLTPEATFDSFKKAYDFFGASDKGYLPLVCSSWLLYPPYKKVFPPKSNLEAFAECFDVIDSGDSTSFADSWRIFGKPENTPISELPVSTRLQSAFLQYMHDGGRHGWGYGIILFDRERIINRNKK